jgi:alkylation response protein AidB-like acyl-CoA dehydrogenase
VGIADARVRGGDRLRAAARGVRQADRAAPGDPAQARADGDEDRGVAACLLLQAAERKDAGERADLEAGMAKWFATETAEEVALEAMRIHGGAGYSQELVVERLYRDAPLLILGEGSNEIQQLVIARRLLERYAV